MCFWPTAKPTLQLSVATVARRLLTWATRTGCLVPFFPLVRATTILADFAFNRFVSSLPALITFDSVILLLGAKLIRYPFVPARCRAAQLASLSTQ